MPIIVWFRRDYRLEDHTALYQACHDSADGIVPVFILDDAILRHPDTGPAIVTFMLGCLAELRENLRRAGGDLIVRHGRPVDELQGLARETGATAIYFNRDYAPGAVERDDEVERDLGRAGLTVRSFKDQVIFEEQEILSLAKGEPYVVYTPYRRAWEKRLAEFGQAEQGPPVLPRPDLRIPKSLAKARSMDLPSAVELGFEATQRIEIVHGESAAQKGLKAFCSGPIQHYADLRNVPARADGTSRISPHLRHGTLSPRQCIRAALAARREGGAKWTVGVNAWMGELIWREFYQQILFNFPEVAEVPFREKWRAMRWRNDEEGLMAWKQGKTGYPIVDAAVRQLNATGWMHNRLRMIVAMFLTKDLLLDYRHGERYFMTMLIDGETAQNNGGWQWSAGCGTDAQPWFRIFNPVSQGEKFDPDGTFVKLWCPELRNVPTEFIHSPWRMSALEQSESHCELGRDYPAPIVDHAEARTRALEFVKG